MIVSAQFSFISDPYKELDVKFSRKKIETQPDQSFFNILSVFNNSNQALSFQLNLAIPQGWSLFCESNQTLTLNPGDSIIIPLRAAVAREVKGEIGYVMVASLADLKGQVVRNEYSFVNIPKKSDLRFHPISRIEYFDQRKKESSFKFQLSNHGNVDESIYINLKLDRSLYIPNSSDNILTDDIFLPVGRDTVVEYPVLLKNTDEFERSSFRISMDVSTKDTVFRSTIWFKDLKSTFVNLIPENNKMLVVDLLASNLFSELPAIYSFGFRGRVLFKNKSDLYYYYHNFNTRKRDDLLKYNQMYMGYVFYNNEIRVGDVTSNLEQSMMGRGIEATFRYRKNELYSVFSKDFINENINYGAQIKSYITRNISSQIGASFNENTISNLQSKVGFGGINWLIKGKQNVGVRFGYSERQIDEQTRNKVYGTGLYLNYNGVFKKTNISLNSRTSSPEYSGANRGRSDIYFNANYQLPELQYINLRYTMSLNDNDILVNSVKKNQRTYYDVAELRYNKYLSANVSYFTGPLIENQSTNVGSFFDGREDFSASNVSAQGGMRFNSLDGVFVSPIIRVGYNFTRNYPDSVLISSGSNNYRKISPDNKPYATGNFTINAQYKGFGLYAAYFHGPVSISQKISTFYDNKFTKSLRLMPYYDKFIYKDLVRYSVRLNFINTIDEKNTRVNFSNEIYGFLPKGFSARFLFTFSYQSLKDVTTDTKETYSYNYFEVGLSKEFGFNQPRLKFYDLNVIFFKDYNGNDVQDVNEPGVKDVLLEITRDESMDYNNVEYKYSGEFASNELLSDQFGKVSYSNIPQGSYFFKLIPMSGIQGNFTFNRNNQFVNINKDQTIFVPFTENNKIFGKVVLNRSKLSNLGKLDISNIKVSATDEKGNIISTLTDKDGNFDLYVPTVDKYVVHINNIFYENFDLQQNDFEVQLNGYRQFEVTFLFNERTRRINFSNALDADALGQNEVRIMKRTSLVGTVKDANSLKPLRAKITVIDNNTQGTIATGNSNMRSGEFSLSFLAGDNYSLIISADDYWFYSENLRLNQLTTFQTLSRDILMKNIEVGSSIQLNNLVFEKGKFDLQPEALAELESLGKLLKENPNVVVEIAGYCDDIEAIEEPAISEERAKTVAKYLLDKGIPNITYKGYINTKPVAANDNEENRKKNRRVEVIVREK